MAMLSPACVFLFKPTEPHVAYKPEKRERNSIKMEVLELRIHPNDLLTHFSEILATIFTKLNNFLN